MQNFIRKYLILLIAMIAFCPIIANAQPGFEGDTRDVPVDGGLSILVAAGGAYVLRKGRAKKKVSG